jgi:hypothetical protein
MKRLILDIIHGPNRGLPQCDFRAHNERGMCFNLAQAARLFHLAGCTHLPSKKCKSTFRTPTTSFVGTAAPCIAGRRMLYEYKIKIGAHAAERRAAHKPKTSTNNIGAQSRREQFCWWLKVSKGTERAYYTKPKETPRGSHSTLPR